MDIVTRLRKSQPAEGDVVHRYSVATGLTLCGKKVPLTDERWLVNRRGTEEQVNCTRCLRKAIVASQPKTVRIVKAEEVLANSSGLSKAARRVLEEGRAVPKPIRAPRKTSATVEGQAVPKPTRSRTKHTVVEPTAYAEEEEQAAEESVG